jgi:hypothetical protein
MITWAIVLHCKQFDHYNELWFIFAMASDVLIAYFIGMGMASKC